MICALVVALQCLTATANEFVGIPIGEVIDAPSTVPTEDAGASLIVEGPFTGLFAMFDRYRAQVDTGSNRLIRAEAQKLYASFGPCSDDTIRLWNQLKQAFGPPLPDPDQAWWFDIGNRQEISVNCKIYGGSGKIALNVIVVDNDLAHGKD